jgi:hypothetical protein
LKPEPDLIAKSQTRSHVPAAAELAIKEFAALRKQIDAAGADTQVATFSSGPDEEDPIVAAAAYGVTLPQLKLETLVVAFCRWKHKPPSVLLYRSWADSLKSGQFRNEFSVASAVQFVLEVIQQCDGLQFATAWEAAVFARVQFGRTLVALPERSLPPSTTQCATALVHLLYGCSYASVFPLACISPSFTASVLVDLLSSCGAGELALHLLSEQSFCDSGM